MPRAAHSFGYTTDSKNIYLLGGEGINRTPAPPMVYSFAGGEWAQLTFKPRLLSGGYPTTEFLADYNQIVTIGDQIELIDIAELSTRTIPIEGNLPTGMNSARWKNQIYLFGGYNASRESSGLTFSDKFYVFDSKTGVISELQGLVSGRITWGKITFGRLYVFGGINSRFSYDDISYYDLLLNTWNFVGRLPHAIENCSIATDDRYIYLMGVNATAGFFGIFSPMDQTYIEFPTNLSFVHGGLIIKDNKAYYFGGETLSSHYAVNNHLYEFDLDELMH